MCTVPKDLRIMPTETTRRAFLKLTTAAASVTAIEFSYAMPAGKAIALMIDRSSPLTAGGPVLWAVEQFRQALTIKGITSSDTSGALTVIVSPTGGSLAKAFG